jgi:flagellin
MGLDIVTNIMAQEASNSLATNESNMQNSLEKLSSGYQINKAADDASGLVISQHLQAQIGGFQQAQANTQSAINVVQTADGALNEVGTILQRINTLAVESANESATDSTAQQAAQAEVSQSLTSLVNIAQTTVYGDNKLLVNGTNTMVNYTFQVGNDNSANSQVVFSVTALSLANLGLVDDTLALATGATNDGVKSISASGLAIGSGYKVVIDQGATAQLAADKTLSGSFAAGTGLKTTFTLTVNGVLATVTINAADTLASFALDITTALKAASAGMVSAVTVKATGSSFTIVDATGGGAGTLVIGGLAAALTSLGLVAGTYAGGAGAGVSIGGGATATLLATQNVSGGVVDVAITGGTAVLTLNGPLVSTSFLGTADYGNGADINSINFSVTAANAITAINSAISTVSALRGSFGAYQNELQHVSDNESVMVQNLQASNAQISDTNMASQMVNFTQDQVLVQAGVSMLAQANQIPTMVLKLLG